MITALCRTVILYFLIMIGLRLMGKRQIGELEPSELVLTMMISDLATVPMQDFGIPLLAGVIPILILLSLTLLMSQLSLLNLRFRALMCGTPAILIRNGKLQQAAMRKNRYTLDELLEQLRGQGCLSVEEVQYAVLENSGQLSVLPWAKAKPPTAEDLGLTLEYLETKGVPVIGYGTKELPAFYTRKSGFAVDYEIDTPEELAKAFHVARQLDMKGGMLVTNPIPEEYSMDHKVIDAAIEQALADAKAQGIHGKETTPFLLARVKDLTGGDSLDSNIQLVYNNARLAARTAYALQTLEQA